MKYRPEHLIFARNLGENPYRVSGNFEAIMFRQALRL